MLEPRRLLFEPHDEPAAEAAATVPPPRSAPPAELGRAPGTTERTAAAEPPAGVVESPRPAGDQEEPATRTSAPPPQAPEPTAVPHAAEPERAARELATATAAPPAVEPPARQPKLPRPAPASPATLRVRAGLAATPQTAPRSRLRSPAAEQSAGGDEVVRITIGRVDVRAVQPPAEAPARSRPAPPRMTLADYLARGRRS